MSHNGSGAEVSRLDLAGRFAAAVAGFLLYLHALPYEMFGGSMETVPAGLAGAFLLAGATYALLADVSIRGTHRRPNAEVGLVGSLFTLLVLGQVGADPALAGALSPGAFAGLAVGTFTVFLASVTYVACPDLFRDPP